MNFKGTKLTDDLRVRLGLKKPERPVFDIPGYSRYEITKDGVVYSKKGYVVANHINWKGYVVYNILSDKGKWVTVGLHRLLALAFIPNPENKPCVDHRDGNRRNNSLSNLRWATYSENNSNPNNKKPSVRKKPIHHKQHKHKKVYQYTTDNAFIKEWDSARKAAEHYKILVSSIYKSILYGKVIKNSLWKYS